MIIATLGRPRTIRLNLDRLDRQTRAADRILVVGVSEPDIAEIPTSTVTVEAYLGPKGSSHQRNYALDRLAGGADLVIFLDDDFLPRDDYFACAERLFVDNPGIVGATGRLIADGAKGPGIRFADAEALIERDVLVERGDAIGSRRALYGCNMVLRATAIDDLRFDENLPLYAWQEDIDFSARVGKRGRLVDCTAMAGVHLGEKAGRTSGRRLGYSQIANPIYLLRKGTIDRDEVLRVLPRYVAANLFRSLNPEPWIDRRGRLNGNLLAIGDYLSGRLDPRRILAMN